MDERSSFRRAIVDAVAGAVSGGVSRTIVAPLDVVKIRFQAWNQQKITALESGPAKELSGLQHFICGLGAGTLAKIVCHPSDVVKKRYQIEGLARHPRYGANVETRAYKSVLHAINRILKSEGWAGPAAAITFVVYEKLQHG